MHFSARTPLPKLVIEIVDDDKGGDFTDKFMEYQSISSIEEYIMIDSTRHFVRRYRRDSEGKLVADFDHIGGSVSLASID